MDRLIVLNFQINNKIYYFSLISKVCVEKKFLEFNKTNETESGGDHFGWTFSIKLAI